MTGPFDRPDNFIGNAGDHAVLFADIVGSSLLYQHLGNVRAQREIDRLLTIMIQVVQAHGGQLVKTIGDEIMVIFEDPECASESAIALNLKIQEQNQSLRTGLAFGSLIFDDLDVFGNTVNRAASLVRAAHSRQILADQALYERMPYWLINCSDLYDRLVLKGCEGKALVYRLNWQADGSDLDVTQVSGSLMRTHSQPLNAMELELTVNKEIFFFAAADKPLTLGRDPTIVHCVVPDPMVSRLHGIISYHRGKYIFEDRSTNGSYLQETTKPKLYLRRESAPLVGQGQILLGQSTDEGTNIIHFQQVPALSESL